VTAALKKWGHAVASASNGAEALKKLALSTYDVVLMDLQMPGMDGFETTRAIREAEAARGRRPGVAIIAVTARTLDQDRARCLAAGMDGFLSKPVDRQTLFHEIARLAPAGATGEAPDVTDALDLAPLLGGDPALVQHVAHLFLTTTPAEIAQLRDAVARRDAPEMRALAHALRGAMAHFANVDTRAAERLEWMADARMFDGAEDAFGQVAEELDRLSQRLRRFLHD
jgi:CheY-like chemotaxis protein